MKVPKVTKRRIMLSVLAVLAVLLCVELYRSNHCLTVDYYSYRTDKVGKTVRVVQLTDLHNAEFGQGNLDLLARVAEQKPDLILFTGDLITGTVQRTDIAAALLMDLVKIAPVYVSIGNHEQMYAANFGSDLTDLFESTGARVLEYEYEDIEVGDQTLRLGGISGYCVPEEFLWTGEAKIEECEFLHEFQDTDRCTLLMAHMPVCWINNDGISAWDTDLVFAGHAHGGQWVIPGIGGVAAPDMGLFPGRLEGLYPSQDGEKLLVLSSGLGNSAPVPRFNNPPQILVLDILPGGQ